MFIHKFNWVKKMIRFFFFLLGFGFSVIGCMYIILYFNLFAIGYSIIDYTKYIFTRPECILGIIGFIIVFFTIFYKGDNNNDICI